MDISKGFDGGIHAIGALILYKCIYQNTTIERISKVNALGSVSTNASDGASCPVLIMH
jgi:hypothetical protein